MKVVHAVKSEDIMMTEMLDIMHNYIKEKSKTEGRTIIYREEFSAIVSKIYYNIMSHETHLIEL